jgi:ribosomal protein S18 acetylase RimI-like enzyme
MHLKRSIEITLADLDLPEHQRAVVELVNAYAMDPMGNGGPLPAKVREALIPGLRKHPTTMIFLAWKGPKAVGIAVCFLGFSTFAARPLVNIHDLAVLPAHRGEGIGRLLLAEVERKAHSLRCCKITLEVLENNRPARKLYASVGFAQAVYQAEAGGALFLAKPLKPQP